MMMIKVMVRRTMVDDDGDFSAMMWTMTFFGLFRIDVTNVFRIASLQEKYLHNTANTALYMFPFASDASV